MSSAFGAGSHTYRWTQIIQTQAETRKRYAFASHRLFSASLQPTPPKKKTEKEAVPFCAARADSKVRTHPSISPGY